MYLSAGKIYAYLNMEYGTLSVEKMKQNSTFAILVIVAILLTPLTNLASANAQVLDNLTSTTSGTLGNVTSTLNNLTSGTLNNTIPILNNLTGTLIFPNGTLSTIVNGVPMTFLLDPKKPSLNDPTVTVNAFDQSGNVHHMFIELQDPNGNDIDTGYTPVSFSTNSNEQYIIYANNYQNTTFSHWDNGSTNPARTITPTQDVTLTAYYNTGTTSGGGGTSTAPSSPTGLTATAVSSSQINLSWTAPSSNGGSTITGYMIERSSDNGNTWSTIVSNTGSTATTFSDTGLASSTTYTYRVSAINSVGTSSPSSIAAATTLSSGSTGGGTSGSIVLNSVHSTSGTVSSSPYQLTIPNIDTSAGSNRLLVVGVEADNDFVSSITFGGAQLTKATSSFHNNYAGLWYLANPSGTGNIVVTMNGPSNVVVGEYSLSGVDQTTPIPTTSTNYNSSPSSPTISITTQYHNSLVIDSPAIYGGSTLGSPACTQGWDTNMPNAVSGASSSTITSSPGSVTCNWVANAGGELWDDTAIEVKASSTTSGGGGTTVTAPSSPTGLTATAVSSSQINLSWTAPSSNGGAAITGYKIERSTNSGMTWSTIQPNTGTASTTYSDAGLAASTTYAYRISAINSAGTSPSSGAASSTTSPSLQSVTLVKSGLMASDSLTNETETQQQLEASTGYWTYNGDAPAEKAPYQFNRDTQGLHIGIEAPSSGTWAGFYAVSPSTNALLWHAVITDPVRTVSNNFYNNGMYVQTSSANVNYVTCVALTNTQATVWAVISSVGNSTQANKFNVLWIDNTANQPLQHDCTIITNGNNYLKVYIDNNLVYSNSTLNLQMPAPFNAYLEPETSSSGQMLVGSYHDYYVTSDENIQVTHLPSSATIVDLVDSSGNLVASGHTSNGAAILNVGKLHLPLSGTIKAYNSSNMLLASGSVNVYGGNVYSVTQ